MFYNSSSQERQRLDAEAQRKKREEEAARRGEGGGGLAVAGLALLVGGFLVYNAYRNNSGQQQQQRLPPRAAELHPSSAVDEERRRRSGAGGAQAAQGEAGVGRDRDTARLGLGSRPAAAPASTSAAFSDRLLRHNHTTMACMPQQELSSRGGRCSFCFDAFSTDSALVPRTPPCGHSLCSSCADHSPSSCPTCSRPVMRRLRADFACTALLEALAKRKGGAAVAAVDKAIEEASACGVCAEQFSSSPDIRVPRCLPCGHGLCTSCVDKIFAGSKLCPICRESFREKPDRNCGLLGVLEGIPTSPKTEFQCKVPSLLSPPVSSPLLSVPSNASSSVLPPVSGGVPPLQALRLAPGVQLWPPRAPIQQPPPVYRSVKPLGELFFICLLRVSIIMIVLYVGHTGLVFALRWTEAIRPWLFYFIENCLQMSVVGLLLVVMAMLSCGFPQVSVFVAIMYIVVVAVLVFANVSSYFVVTMLGWMKVFCPYA